MSSPTFQHRHYKAIAAALAGIKPATSGTLGDTKAQAMWLEAQSTMADMFASDNPRFDRKRFDAACNGTPSNGKDRPC